MTIAACINVCVCAVRAAGVVWAGHCWAGIAREVWRAGRQQRRGCSLCPALPSLQLTLTLGTCLASQPGHSGHWSPAHYTLSWV